MGKMKWIYGMVQEGTSYAFLDAYKKARINNSMGFKFDDKYIDIVQAKAIVNQIKIAEKDYDKHIDEMAERHFDMLHDIARGK